MNERRCIVAGDHVGGLAIQVECPGRAAHDHVERLPLVAIHRLHSAGQVEFTPHGVELRQDRPSFIEAGTRNGKPHVSLECGIATGLERRVGAAQRPGCREIAQIEALRLSDVCVTYFSTVSVEAMIIGKPVIYIQYVKEHIYTLQYASRYGAGIDAESPEDLQAAIESLIRDEMLVQEITSRGHIAVKEELAGLDGGSLRRIIDEITLLVDRRKGHSKPSG